MFERRYVFISVLRKYNLFSEDNFNKIEFLDEWLSFLFREEVEAVSPS